MSNEVVQFQAFIKNEAVLRNIQSTLGDVSKSQKFVASLISAVNTNPALKDCAAETIITAALLGESLQLSPSPQLGHFYIIPYEDKKNNRKVATFQLGYKGYLQLAIRSGQYKTINVISIKQGELISYDPLTEELKANIIDDDEIRENTETIGYYAMFELVNGFRKSIYWSKKKVLTHADKYSQAFSVNESKVKTKNGEITKVSFTDYENGNYEEKTSWLYSSFWYKDFDGMAFKTLLRQLISKWGIMSIELQKAFVEDMAFNDNGVPVYVDNDQPRLPVTEIINQDEPTETKVINTPKKVNINEI